MKTMLPFNNFFFKNHIVGMSEIPLNKFEKEKRVIEFHKEGKTIREIAKEVYMSFRYFQYHKQIQIFIKR